MRKRPRYKRSFRFCPNDCTCCSTLCGFSTRHGLPLPEARANIPNDTGFQSQNWTEAWLWQATSPHYMHVLGMLHPEPHRCKTKTASQSSTQKVRDPGLALMSWVNESHSLLVGVYFLNFLARPLCRNVSGIFVVQISEDFAGDFPGGLFWVFFQQK